MPGSEPLPLCRLLQTVQKCIEHSATHALAPNSAARTSPLNCACNSFTCTIKISRRLDYIQLLQRSSLRGYNFISSPLMLPECCTVQLQHKKLHTNVLKHRMCSNFTNLFNQQFNIQRIIPAWKFGVVAPLIRCAVNQEQAHSQAFFLAKLFCHSWALVQCPVILSCA